MEKILKIGFCVALFTAAFSFNGCGPLKCGTIEISEALATAAKHETENYCSLVSKAEQGDVGAAKQLSLLGFSDGLGYEHGVVLIEIIDAIGEQKFTAGTKDLDRKHKNLLYSTLMAGFDATQNSKYKKKNVEGAFPLLYKSISPDLSE